MTISRRAFIVIAGAAILVSPEVVRPRPPKPKPTKKPTPPPPPTPPTLPGRDQLVPGAYFPGGSNTGLLTDPSTLTLVPGSVTYSTTTPRVIRDMRFGDVVAVN